MLRLGAHSTFIDGPWWGSSAAGLPAGPVPVQRAPSPLRAEISAGKGLALAPTGQDVVATKDREQNYNPQELIAMAEGAPEVALRLGGDPADEDGH